MVAEGWVRRTPADAAALLAGYPGLWWMAGGWALQAFTGVAREHDDCDPCVLRSDLPLLRAHLSGRLEVWAATDGVLTPLGTDDDLPAGCGQVWLRPSAAEPWEHDVLLSPGTREEWVYKRDPSLRMPMAEALWQRDGVRYLQPEVQLLHKAKGLRPKDQADLDATLPHLDDRRRRWLAAALDRTLPGHPWIPALRPRP
ncbi:hypothetical protein [Nocardioides litoris]|uniref:hypothetical protein n=1 Tax=Nocardioides litoris TaxID=1926648 RepID=UPI00111EA763|nr:hypothetical protein [Nocardioides litoris]